MRSLGAFFGHVAQAVRQDVARPPAPRPAAAQRTQVRREVREQTQPVDGGQVTLRRTIVEEIEIRPTEGGS